MPDAELTERIRAGAPTAFPAMEELRRRNLPAVQSYARLCSRGHAAANQLAAHAFALAWQEVRRGIDPRGAWRHRLLLLVHQAAVSWAGGSRRTRLAPDFAAFIDNLRDTEPVRAGQLRHRMAERSAILGAFNSLPTLTQGILWHSVIEGEPDSDVATVVGVEPKEVSELAARSQEAFRAAYLRTYLERSGDARCRGFGRILEAAVRRADVRHSEDLQQHLSECPGCTGALAVLRAIEEHPGAPVLAGGLLGWAGAAYLEARSALDARGSAPPHPDPAGLRLHLKRMSGRLSGLPTRLSPAPVVLVVLLAAVVATAVTGLVATSYNTTPASSASAAPLPSVSTVPVTPPAPVPTPSATATSTAPVKQPSPSSTSGPWTAVPVPVPSPSTSPPPSRIPGSTFAEVVNAGSGLCLDVYDGIMAKRTDVITARCTGAQTQQWRLDTPGLLRNQADPDFCLDSRGDTDRGVGIWPCSSIDGRNGDNLRFTIDSLGRIRAVIAPDFAVTPCGDSPGSPIALQPAAEGADQRWTAGSTT